ncbi:MAG: hypothetical protein AB7O62_19535 [Pirellulales bacterium]
MTIHRTLLAASMLILGVFASANTAKAEHIHDLAEDLEGMSRALVSEYQAHYRYLPEYRHLMHDAMQVAKLASHIHDMTDYRASLRHIQHDLHELDDLYHHMENTLDRVESYRGFRHGTRHVRGLMHTFHDTLEHLQDDVAELTAPPRPVYPGPGFRQPPISRPGIQFQFRFPFGR